MPVKERLAWILGIIAFVPTIISLTRITIYEYTILTNFNKV